MCILNDSRWRAVAGAVLAYGLLSITYSGSLVSGWAVLLAAESAPQSAVKADITQSDDMDKDVTQGALRIKDKQGHVVECPLKHTDVTADVAGFIARVTVTQTFENPTNEKIEAVYVFPLPHEAAVDGMTMLTGQRKVVGLIKRRAEARQIYEQALYAGQTAALLEQERPNIFTQSVGNIPPRGEVRIEITYVDVLRYDLGSYEFHFPMVVGPRYNPGAPIASPSPTPAELQSKVSPPQPDTTRVPDASRISPPVLKPGHRTGHDISLSMSLDAGVPIQNLTVANHRAEVKRSGKSAAAITLAKDDTLPNKDFVLRYDVVGNKPEMAVLAHTGGHSSDAGRLGRGYFMLMIQPREDDRLTKSPPREIVFLVDVSGSMSGQPTAKVIEAMHSMLKLCRDKDTVQVITFANQANKLFERPVPVNGANIQRALNFTHGLRGGGGTEMLKGVTMAIDEPIDKERIRIIVMLTDGYIGNEAEIVKHVGERCGDQIRFWAIGIGQSPNMFLIDGVARQGGGMGKKLGLNDDTAALTQEVMTRIQRAQLAHITLDFGTLSVAETYPAKLPELWAGRPVIVFGRYRDGGKSAITVHGSVEGEAVSWPLEVNLPGDQARHDVLAKVWARQKIESLMHSTFYQGSPAVEEEVTALALDYRLMSQYTSFVAVDTSQAEALAESPRAPRRMLVPVPLPEGTRWEGFFGELAEFDEKKETADVRMLNAPLSMNRHATSRQPMPALSLEAAPAARGLSVASVPLRQAAGMAGGSARVRLGLPAAGPTPSMSGALSAPGIHRAWPAKRAVGRVRALAFSPMGDTPAAAREESPLAQEQLARTFNGLLGNAGQLAAVAQKALESGQELQNERKLAAAHQAFERAYLLAGADPGGQGITAAAQAALEQVHTAEIAAWKKQLPQLDRRLDLIIRDQSIEDALAAVAKAAGVTVQFLPGSVVDVEPLVREEPRVTFLDLRGATVSQSLDWILLPVRLRWQVRDQAVIAGSARRSGDECGWIYDVSQLVLPSQKELQSAPDNQKAAVVQKAFGDFLAAVRRELKVAHDASVTWFAPGQLLVFGGADRHAAAATLLANLADARFNPSKQLADLHKVASRRAKQRKAADAKARAQEKLAAVAARHHEFGWPLLAQAAAGKIDLEALTELQIAWKQSQTAELLAGEHATAVLRTGWIIAEAARALPAEAELQSLAAIANERIRARAARDLAALEQNPEDPKAFYAVLYAALARRDDASVREQALRAIGRSVKQWNLAQACTAASALLGSPEQLDRAALSQLAQSAVVGEDLVVLTALACRRAGGSVWNEFRARSQDLLGEQSLPGGVVVLVSQLSGSSLPLFAAR